VDHGKGPVRRHLRRTVHQSHGGIMFNRPPTHEINDRALNRSSKATLSNHFQSRQQSQTTLVSLRIFETLLGATVPKSDCAFAVYVHKPVYPACKIPG
jgi:hypothetical protein